MYYSNEDIDAFEKKVQVTPGESYVRKAALGIASMLEKDPSIYKTFGVYWWAIKAAIKKYYSGKAWFTGDYFDQLMYERAWHGSQFRTVLAGAIYQENHRLITSGHEYTGKDGEDYSYTLFDENAGF